MNLFSRRWWVLLLTTFLIAGCAPAEASIPADTPSILSVNITPAARPVVPTVSACAASLSGIQVEIEERFSSQTNSDLLIRLGIPDPFSGFLAQIATDELAVALHPDNPAASLTPIEIQALFSGQVTNWAEYEGNDIPVQVWVPLSVDETRLEFDSRILQGLPVRSDARLAPDPGIMQEIIAANPSAIGYLPNSWRESDLHTILLGIQMPVLVAADQTPQGPAADLIACLQGEVGQQVLRNDYP
jgi:hypothetical protein